MTLHHDALTSTDALWRAGDQYATAVDPSAGRYHRQIRNAWIAGFKGTEPNPYRNGNFNRRRRAAFDDGHLAGEIARAGAAKAGGPIFPGDPSPSEAGTGASNPDAIIVPWEATDPRD